MATKLDPSFSKSDNLSGQVVSIKGKLPEVRSKVQLDVSLLKEMVGSDGESTDVYPLRQGEPLMVTVATAKSVGTVSNNQKDKVFLNLKLPICANIGSRLSLSRRVGTRWRLIGHASIIDWGVNLPKILVDTCGWIAVINAGINIDHAFSRIFGRFQFIVIDSVWDELRSFQDKNRNKNILLELLMNKSTPYESKKLDVNHTDDIILF